MLQTSKSVERKGKCDKNKQEGASWETVTEMEGGRTRKKTQKEIGNKTLFFPVINLPLEGQ